MRYGFGLVGFCLSALASGAAYADAIDGTWCAEKDNRQITIQGSTARLASGQTIQGDYSRHAFSFEVPPPLNDAGQTIDMRLLGETVLRAITISADKQTRSQPELWRRCEQTS